MLLGTVGWERADWLGSYYPLDLPPEWRLAYYANDCSCVLLPAAAWCAVDRQRLRACVQEAPDRLQYFLQAPAAGAPGPCPNLTVFEAKSAILLVDRPDPWQVIVPQWVAQGSGLWVDSDSDASLICWSIERADLRQLRARAETLQRGTRALVLDGVAADPGSVPKLRTLLELMGKP